MLSSQFKCMNMGLGLQLHLNLTIMVERSTYSFIKYMVSGCDVTKCEKVQYI